MTKKEKKIVQDKIENVKSLLQKANKELSDLAFPLSTINKYTNQLGHAHNAVSLAKSILTELQI